jgi:hypothetical protein
MLDKPQIVQTQAQPNGVIRLTVPARRSRTR